MASRIMHLSIAKLVDEKIDFSDKDSFYLGCLALLVDNTDEVFHVYPKKAVLEFIDTVVSKSYESILNIRREQGLEESVHYFVPMK